MTGISMENDDNELTEGDIQGLLNYVFGVAAAFYADFADEIPEEEKSDYVFGNDFEEAVKTSIETILNSAQDPNPLEPYCALLGIVIACRVYRNGADPDGVDANLDYDGDRNGRAVDITIVTSHVQGKIEEIENLEQRSGRQTAILQICYLILAEAELSTGDIEAQGLDFIIEACNLPPIQFYPDSAYTFDQKLRMRCLQACGVIEYIHDLDYVWDLTDREYLKFWAELTKARAISHVDIISANVPTLLLKETTGLVHRSLVTQDTAREPYFLDSFNASLRELLEIAELFRDKASEIDIPDSDEPRTSDPRGSAYWCWMLGQLIGIVAKLSGLVGIDNILSDRSWFNGSSSTHMTLSWHVFSLFAECTEGRDWAHFKMVSTQAWFSLLQDKYSDIDEITPATRSYWAMRIGICDAYLDSELAVQESTTLVPSGALVGSVDQEIVRQIVDQLTTNLASTVIGERVQLSTELQEIKSRLPASSNQIKEFVNECLGDVLTEYNLPRVRSHLIKAERYYRTEVDVDESKVSFAKSVEGTLRSAFVKGFMEFVQERGSQSFDIVFAGKRGVEISTADKINKFSLGEWSDAFSALNSTSPIKTMARSSLLGQYLAASFDDKPVQVLDGVTFNLGKVQALRNSASHYHEDGRPDEADRLEELRGLVLGIRCKSVIEDIVQSFRSVDGGK